MIRIDWSTRDYVVGFRRGSTGVFSVALGVPTMAAGAIVGLWLGRGTGDVVGGVISLVGAVIFVVTSWRSSRTTEWKI